MRLLLGYGRVVHGTLQEETDSYYKVVVEKVEYTGGFEKLKKSDWKKGDVIKFSKEIVMEVEHE